MNSTGRPVRRRLATAAVALVALALAAVTPSAARFADEGAVRAGLGTAEPVPVLLGGGVDAGDAWSVGWEGDGRLYSWGGNGRGELGQGAEGGAVLRPMPVALPEGVRVQHASAGINLGIALAEDGGVWTWGNPDIGGNTATPQRLGFFDDLGDPVVGVDAGGYYYLAWTAGGALYSWGNAGSGRLGRPGTNPHQPARVTAQGLAGRLVGTASAGRFHGAAVTRDGEVVVWGSNNGDASGRAVLDPVAGGCTSVAAGNRSTLLVAADGTLWSTDGAATATQVPGLTGIVGASISSPVSGASSAWAWDAAGGLWAWGANGTGLLGLGTVGGSVASPTPVPLPPDALPGGGPIEPRVAGGATHALYDSGAGTFAAAGDNGSGQLGDGTTGSRATFELTIPVARWP